MEELPGISYYPFNGNLVELRLSRGQGSPIQTLAVFRSPQTPPRYGGHEQVDLAPGFPMPVPPRLDDRVFRSTGAVTWYTLFQPDEIDAKDMTPERAANPTAYDPWFDCVIAEGAYTSNEGKLFGVLYPEAKTQNFAFLGAWRQN